MEPDVEKFFHVLKITFCSVAIGKGREAIPLQKCSFFNIDQKGGGGGGQPPVQFFWVILRGFLATSSEVSQLVCLETLQKIL